MVGTKPDLAHAVNMVSEWIFKYLRGFTDYEIMFARQKGFISVVGYIDVDYADVLDRTFDHLI